MVIRVFADREPYKSYGASIGGNEGFVLSVSPLDAASEPADLSVIPVERYLALPESLRLMPSFAYGPAALIGLAFEAGCLDYLREPWNLSELFARSTRIKVTRAAGKGFVLELVGGTLRILAPLRDELALSEPEQKLLRLLMLNAGTPVPRSALCFALWGDDGRRSRAPDVHISSIRRRMEGACPGMGALIKASRGSGYRLLAKTCA
ncbi:MAG TPA: winged helix-turn-helix domain-containing protein [Rectinemataceae bacterium]|nr:winged helix-turn-helix domain-containing protein [Rectinemataceae bacterium]